MSNELTFVPLNKLVRSSLNVRKTGADSIDDLAASIAVHGLLQNLTVTKKSATGKTKSKADTYEVVAGGRRLAALQSLAKQQKIPKDYAVPCKVVTDSAEELSLVETRSASRCIQPISSRRFTGSSAQASASRMLPPGSA